MYNEEFTEVRFTGSKKKREMPQHYMRFMEILDEGTKLKDGHFTWHLERKRNKANQQLHVN